MLAEIVTPELFASAVRLATPIALAATGAAICERSGVVNIAMEGLMLIAAFAGVAAALLTGSTWLGVVAAVLASVIFASLHAWASINLRADQVISATAINITALGVTGFLMETVFGRPGTTDSVQTLQPVFDFPMMSGTGLLPTVWRWIDVVFLSYTPIVYVRYVRCHLPHVGALSHSLGVAAPFARRASPRSGHRGRERASRSLVRRVGLRLHGRTCRSQSDA